MRIAFKTFGCRANSLDTDALYLEAKKRGFEVVPETESAEAYVINTCTVTENADRDARQQAFRFKRQNQGALVAMVGCYAQVAKDELLSLPEVDFVVGTANKFKTLEYLSESLAGQTVARDQVEKTAGFLPEHFPGSRNARANIKIQDGCNYRCSFCIIPTARGRSRSLPLNRVLDQVVAAQEDGFKEIVLTGIHLAHYGWDQGTDLAELLKRIFGLPNGPRVRVSTLDPFEIPEGMTDYLGTESRFCPHFHIALQSGSDRVLSAMRRLYKAEEFVQVCNRIGRRSADTFVGVDVIVGFPGEGEAEFQETVECLKNSYWTKLHVFSFSARAGTTAYDLQNQNSAEVIAERSEILRRLSDERLNQFLTSQIGKTREVVMEKTSRRDGAIWQGHTDNYIPTRTRGDFTTKEVVSLRLDRVDGDKIWTR